MKEVKFASISFNVESYFEKLLLLGIFTILNNHISPIVTDWLLVLVFVFTIIFIIIHLFILRKC